jgi:hypothetical protein
MDATCDIRDGARSSASMGFFSSGSAWSLCDDDIVRRARGWSNGRRRVEVSRWEVSRDGKHQDVGSVVEVEVDVRGACRRD